MLIIADARMPETAKKRLETFGKTLWIEPQNSVYAAIAAHPDIFFCQVNEKIIAAPNAPKEIIDILHQQHIPVVFGTNPVGAQHPETVYYNAVFTPSHFIHNTKLSDKTILEQVENRKVIHVSQAYTRCNLMPLSDTSFLTSDQGIEKALLRHGLDVFFVCPDKILLAGLNHGFIGGCCGMMKNSLLLMGALALHSQAIEIKNFVTEKQIEIIELYGGQLWDGGGIFYIT